MGINVEEYVVRALGNGRGKRMMKGEEGEEEEVNKSKLFCPKAGEHTEARQVYLDLVAGSSQGRNNIAQVRSFPIHATNALLAVTTIYD